MNEAQEAIYAEMTATWVGNDPIFRADCDRLITAGKVVVDIGEAVATLQASPELCDVFAGLLKTDPVVWQHRVMRDWWHASHAEWCDWHNISKERYEKELASVEAGNTRLQVRALCVAA